MSDRADGPKKAEEPDGAEDRGGGAGRRDGGPSPSAPRERLFVGVWPPPEVIGVLSRLDRPERAGVRWTTPDQWHVTLAFLGEVASGGIDDLAAALSVSAARVAAPEADLGPATSRLGRSVLHVPVRGLETLAAEVRGALAGVLPGAGLDAPFVGHLTIARARGRRAVPPTLAGTALEASWRVREVTLVRSEFDPAGARYTTLVSATVGR